MARYSRRVVLFLGILFHLVQLGSIFDIYFVTPLVHGMKEFKPDVQAPAKRVVLIVGMSCGDLLTQGMDSERINCFRDTMIRIQGRIDTWRRIYGQLCLNKGGSECLILVYPQNLDQDMLLLSQAFTRTSALSQRVSSPSPDL